jgi:hypothetical protein
MTGDAPWPLGLHPHQRRAANPRVDHALVPPYTSVHAGLVVIGVPPAARATRVKFQRRALLHQLLVALEVGAAALSASSWVRYLEQIPAQLAVARLRCNARGRRSTATHARQTPA